jgi:branched-chain amino acid transport system permease protein
VSTYVIALLAGLGSAAILFLVASGLTLIFGALRIVQFAHGSVYMIGAFLTTTLAFTFGGGSNSGGFWLTLLIAGLFVAALGAVTEVTIFRRIYSQPFLTQFLVTFAFVLIIGGAVRATYGTTPRIVETPSFADGSIAILDRRFPVYLIFLMGLALLVAGLLWWVLYGTNLGRMIRAAVSDSELLALSGGNVAVLFTGVFALGAFLAGAAGAAVTPMAGASLGIDIAVILKAFIVVVIGGLGSIRGALIGSILVGVAEAFGILWVPQASLAIVFAVLVIALVLRPQGIFGSGVPFELAGSAQPEGLTTGWSPFQVLRPLVAKLPRPKLSLPRPSLARALARADLPPVEDARVNRGLWLLTLGGIAAFAALPFWAGVGDTLLMREALILALFAMSLNLLVGTTGLMSFGHAMFYGLGGFAVALSASEMGWPPLTGLVIAPAVAAVTAFVTGLIVLRGTALYFGLLTLGVAQLFWATANGWRNLTGGENGVPGNYAPGWLQSFDDQYWFIFGSVVFCIALLYIITRSPFGDTLRGIRENRRRATFMGVWVKRYELTAFVIAGTFGGVAGGLFAMHSGLVSSTIMDWRSSALPLIVGLIGGVGAFLGPAVGALFYSFVQEEFVSRTILWDLAIGIVVLGVILLAPRGLAGVIRWLVVMVITLYDRALGRVPAPAPAPIATTAGALADASPAAQPEPSIAYSGNGGNGNSNAQLTPLLEIRGLSKSFGGLIAVDDINLDVHEGTIHAIIGPNGAGKTTVFNLITGLIEQDAGRIFFRSEDVSNEASWRLVKKGMGRSFQQASLFWALSATDNVLLGEAAARDANRRLYGTHDADLRARAASRLETVQLGEVGGIMAKELGHGEQRSLELAAALAVESRFLMLDEPTAGMSPNETREAVELIQSVAREQGLTVLFVEHDMEVVFTVADRVTVLNRGAVLADGTPEEIRNNADVQRAYLGGGDEQL